MPRLPFSLAAPRGMWDLSSTTRDRTCAPCSGSYAHFYVFVTFVTTKSDGALLQFLEARCEIEVFILGIKLQIFLMRLVMKN